MVPEAGFEPTFTGSKPVVLPLDDPGMIWWAWPVTIRHALRHEVLSLARLPISPQARIGVR